MTTHDMAAPGMQGNHWQKATAGWLLSIAVILALFWQTFVDTAAIWWRSDTFTHGAFIPLISAWLIWRIRDRWLRERPQLGLIGVPPLIALALIWLVGAVAEINVIQQLAVWAMLPLVTLICMGANVTRCFMFPLAYLVFAVPFGEGLIPILMDFTASFTVKAVELTGIPVYREGYFFEMSSGPFEVAVACSGIRYLMASVAVGSLYAYLTYQSAWRRSIFILVSIIVPIIANGVRAYGIVMIAHYTERQHAVGVDHLIYGWLFFGVVVFLMFQIGALWREKEGTQSVTEIPSQGPSGSTKGPNLLLVVLVVVATVLPFRIWAESINRTAQNIPPLSSLSSPTMDDWMEIEARTEWHPTFAGADAQLLQHYKHVGASENEWIALFIGTYSYQEEGRELVSSTNRFFPVHEWSPVSQQRQTLLDLTGRTGVVEEIKYTDINQRKWLLWQWFEMQGQAVDSRAEVKWLDAKAKLLGQKLERSAAIAIMTPLQNDMTLARARIIQFIRGIDPQKILEAE